MIFANLTTAAVENSIYRTKSNVSLSKFDSGIGRT